MKGQTQIVTQEVKEIRIYVQRHNGPCRDPSVWVAWVWRSISKSEWYVTAIGTEPKEFRNAINANFYHDTEQAAVEFAVQTAEKFYNEIKTETETESP